MYLMKKMNELSASSQVKTRTQKTKRMNTVQNEEHKVHENEVQHMKARSGI